MSNEIAFVMRQALEALEECRRDPRLKYEHPILDKAITSLRVAIASYSQAIAEESLCASSTAATQEPSGPATSADRYFYEAGFEAGRQQGMKQERALWELARIGQEIEAEAEKQEPDDLTIAYMSGFHDGKKKREWVGLNWDDLPEIYVGDTAFLHGAKWAEAKLKAKNERFEKNT